MARYPGLASFALLSLATALATLAIAVVVERLAPSGELVWLAGAAAAALTVFASYRPQ